MDDKELRRIDPQSYPENLRQTIYYAKECLQLKKQAEREKEHAKTHRKRALEIIIKEAGEVIEKAKTMIKNKKLTEIEDTQVNIGKKMISAVVSGEEVGVGMKKKEEN